MWLSAPGENNKVMDARAVDVLIRTLDSLTKYSLESFIKVEAFEKMLERHPNLYREYKLEFQTLNDRSAIQLNRESISKALTELRAKLPQG
jgi:hypothetical protein